MFALPGVKISNIIIELDLKKESCGNYFFLHFNEHSTPLFSKAKILKFTDIFEMENCIFINKSVSGSLHPLFSQVYSFVNDHHNYNTRFASNGLLKIPTNNTSIYGTRTS